MTISPWLGSKRDGLVRGRGSPSTRRRMVLGALATLTLLSFGLLTPTRPAHAATGQPVLSAPVSPFRVERLAALPPQRWLAGHRGLDLNAGVATPVVSPATGVVSFVGFVVDRPVISIRHDQGLVSSFEPVDSALTVGDVVEEGETIGVISDAPHHCAPELCVHWGLRLNGEYVDPLDYLEGFGPIRLLPLNGA